MENKDLRAVTRNLFIELVIYSALVLGYSVVVLRWLSEPLRQLSPGNSVVYALLSLGLIVAQGALLDLVTALLQTDTPVARHLRHGAQILEQRRVSAELRLRHGVVADEIIREAREGNNDLVLVGAAKGRMKLKRLMLGEVTEQVVRRSPRSVLVVRKRLGGGR